jgi:hypothetical protein
MGHMNGLCHARTKEAKTGQKSRTPRIFFPFIGFCRSLLAERTATLIEHVRIDALAMGSPAGHELYVWQALKNKF